VAAAQAAFGLVEESAATAQRLIGQKLPVPPGHFPVQVGKFPVRLRREFNQKGQTIPLITAAKDGQMHRDCGNPLYFPC